MKHASVQATPAARRLAFEDSTGICDTVPGDLRPAEACTDLGANPVPMEPDIPSLWSVLALTGGVAFAAVVALHLALRLTAP